MMILGLSFSGNGKFVEGIQVSSIRCRLSRSPVISIGAVVSLDDRSPYLQLPPMLAQLLN